MRRRTLEPRWDEWNKSRSSGVCQPTLVEQSTSGRRSLRLWQEHSLQKNQRGLTWFVTGFDRKHLKYRTTKYLKVERKNGVRNISHRKGKGNISEEGQGLLADTDRWRDKTTLLKEYYESRKRERINEELIPQTGSSGRGKVGRNSGNGWK